MPMHATEAELRIALISIVAAASSEPHLRAVCAEMMDGSAQAAARADLDVLGIAGPGAPASVRFGALRTLTHLCAACQECPRGQDITGGSSKLMARYP